MSFKKQLSIIILLATTIGCTSSSRVVSTITPSSAVATTPSTPDALTISSASLDLESHQIILTGTGLNGLSSANLSGLHGLFLFDVAVTNSTSARLTTNNNFNLKINSLYTINVGNGTTTASLDVIFEQRRTSKISAILESSGNTYFNSAVASTMCRALEAPCVVDSEGAACDSTVYTDWRLPSAEELSLFTGIAALDVGDDGLLSGTPSATNSRYIRIDMVYGSWSPDEYVQTRCVR